MYVDFFKVVVAFTPIGFSGRIILHSSARQLKQIAAARDPATGARHWAMGRYMHRFGTFGASWRRRDPRDGCVAPPRPPVLGTGRPLGGGRRAARVGIERARDAVLLLRGLSYRLLFASMCVMDWYLIGRRFRFFHDGTTAERAVIYAGESQAQRLRDLLNKLGSKRPIITLEPGSASPYPQRCCPCSVRAPR
jgi:hypothetical protein